MSGAVRIRHATEWDAQALARVLSGALKAAYLGAGGAATGPHSRQRLATLEPADLLECARARLADADAVDWTIVAEANGEVLGFGRLRVHRAAGDGCEGEIASLYVDPSAWSAGSGSRLLEHGLEELQQRGCPRAWLWVAEENERATRFYRRHSFEPDGAEEGYRFEVWGVDLGFELTVVRYSRRLPAAGLRPPGTRPVTAPSHR